MNRLAQIRRIKNLDRLSENASFTACERKVSRTVCTNEDVSEEDNKPHNTEDLGGSDEAHPTSTPHRVRPHTLITKL